MSNPHLDQLERDLKMLRIEFEKYFNGASDIPPAELQSTLRNRIRHLRGEVRASADRFRLSTLEARFNTYNELFNRRLREFEEGRTVMMRRVSQSPGTFDVQKGVVVGERLEDGAVSALYKGLYGTPAKSKKVDLTSFRSYLDKQAAMIRDKTGCAEVQFRLAHQDGKLKLKAKPIRAKG